MTLILWRGFCGLMAGAVTGFIITAVLEHLGVGPIRFWFLAAWLIFWVAIFIKERHIDY